MEDCVLVARLASRHFFPGGVVKGFVQLVSHEDKNNAHAEIAYVVAQAHGHVTVDTNLLTLPVVHVSSTRTEILKEQTILEERALMKQKVPEDAYQFDKLPDVRNFSGDTGTCIFCSTPSLLFSDINIAPTQSEFDAAAAKSHSVDPVIDIENLRKETAERCTREFALALPPTICPSFRGTSAKVFYVITITAQCAVPGSKPVSVHLPFDVYGSEYFFGAGTAASEYHLAESHSALSNDSTLPTSDTNNETTTKSRHVVSGTSQTGRLARSSSSAPAPAGVRIGSEIAFELRPSLMHGRVETEQMQRAQTSIFTIGKESSHLVRFLLTKQSYQPGDILLGVFDFTRANIPCYKVSATLCQEETLSSMALDPDRVVQSKVFGSFHEHTLGVLHTNMRLSIPHDALATIKTDLVRIQWLLRFEFSAGAPPTQIKSEAAQQQQRQTFQWHVPIVVQPAIATKRCELANVPHKLYSGSFRVASLEVAES